MCSKEDIVRIRHILDAAKETVSFAQGKTRKSLDKNRLIHAYFDINLDIVWQTVTEDLPSS